MTARTVLRAMALVIVLLVIGALWSLTQAQTPAPPASERDSTIYTATRIRTTLTGKILSVSVTKVATLPSGRVDTVKVPLPPPPPVHDTVHSYWTLTIAGTRGIYGIASNVGTKPVNFTLPVARVDTVRPPPVVIHDTLPRRVDTVYVPVPTPAPTPVPIPTPVPPTPPPMGVELPRATVDTRMPPAPAPGGIIRVP